MQKSSVLVCFSQTLTISLSYSFPLRDLCPCSGRITHLPDLAAAGLPPPLNINMSKQFPSLPNAPVLVSARADMKLIRIISVNIQKSSLNSGYILRKYRDYDFILFQEIF